MTLSNQPASAAMPPEARDATDLLADWISRDALAQALGLTADTLSRWEARRVGPPCSRIGRTVVYRRAAIQDWLQAQEREHPPRKQRGQS